MLCLNHIQQIKQALGIAGIQSRVCCWLSKAEEEKRGAQIDLLIDRADDVVNVCEMKFSKAAFAVTNAYAKKLVQRLHDLETLHPQKTFHLTLISVNSMQRNEYSDIFTSAVVAEDLFA
jgi:hypothetical protein